MAAVFLSRPVKQFGGSRRPLAELALDGFEALLATGGAPPELLLLCSAHPYELAGVTGPELADRVRARARELGLSTRVEFYANPGLTETTAHLAASAAGAALVHEAVRRVASGEEPGVAVLAVEQMRLTERDETTRALRSLIHPEEQAAGLTMPALGALLTRRLTCENPELTEALIHLMLANRTRTVLNPRAHVRKALRREEIVGERNPVVSDPLRLFDVAPTTTGYAGLFLTAEPAPLSRQVQVAGIGHGLDTVSVARRPRPDRSEASRRAMFELLSALGWSMDELRPKVACAEIHDAFPIIEYLGLKECGLAEPGRAVEQVLTGRFDPGGACPVNVMGGVMGGHPIAATGVGQLIELYLQAVGRAETDLPKSWPHYSLAFNVGGPLTYNAVTLLAAWRSVDGPPREFTLSPRPHSTAADLDRGAPDELSPGPARVLSATRLEFPAPGFEEPCRIALVDGLAGIRFVPVQAGDLHPGDVVDLVRIDRRLVARPAAWRLERHPVRERLTAA